MTMALRSGGVLVIFLPLLLIERNRHALVTAHKRAHLWHAFFGLSSMACFYYGLGYLPLVVVTSINFTTPIFVMLMAIPLLKETPDRFSWIAAGVGFCGTLLVLNPTAADFNAVGLVILTGALLTGCMIIVIRKMPANSTHFAVLFYYAALGALVFGIIAVLTATPEEWAALRQPVAWLYLAGIAFFACTLQFLLTLAYRLSMSSSIAALDYLRLIWAGGLGYLVFGELPGPLAVVGMVLIIASGIALIIRQRAQARRGSAR
nr:DMT family transporter [Acuticoccus mangrovi]